MNILTVNTGSSSVRLEIFSINNSGQLSSLHKGHYVNKIRLEPESLLKEFIADHDIATIDVIAHRVVHGGTVFTDSCLIDDQVEQEIGKLASLAPLHNPLALAWIRAVSATMENPVPQVAVFDTAFFQDLPDVAAAYPLPVALCAEHGIRRYGFHGIAHRAMWQSWAEARSDLSSGGRLLTLQLGGGCSIAAILRGRVMDTSMGFSPLEGLMMTTRCGDLDPGIITYLLRNAGYTLEQLERLLNHESGLAGMSTTGADMRLLLQSREPQDQLAVQLFCYRIRKYLGAYIAVLGGVDGIVFGGGIGEHAPFVRELILQNLDVFGIVLDPDANREVNAARFPFECISAEQSAVDVRVAAVDEAGGLAREAVRLLQSGQPVLSAAVTA